MRTLPSVRKITAYFNGNSDKKKVWTKSVGSLRLLYFVPLIDGFEVGSSLWSTYQCNVSTYD